MAGRLDPEEIDNTQSLLSAEEHATEMPFEENVEIDPGTPAVRTLRPKLVFSNDFFKRMELGNKKYPKSNKVIMFVGQTGSGKTTIINALINYILGVQWTDNYRYKLIEESANTSQAHSQTSDVMVNHIHWQNTLNIPYSLTIIDTPGFSDTRGLEQDRNTVKQLEQCFTNPEGVDHIDGVYFVVQSSVNRLTLAQKYVFDSVLSIFSYDIAPNILICATFADHKKPSVLEALIEAEVPCAKTDTGEAIFFKFNNCALYPDKSGHEINYKRGEKFYKMGFESFNEMFHSLEGLIPKSLILTKIVLEERRDLEIILEGLISKIKDSQLKCSSQKELEESVKGLEDVIKETSDFEFEIKDLIKSKIAVKENAINCKECQSTCQHPTMVKSNAISASEIFQGRQCAVCDHNVNSHCLEKQIWKGNVVNVKITFIELLLFHQLACAGKFTVELLLERLKVGIQELEEEQKHFTERAEKCIRRLQEIALKPDPLTIPDYINLLIQEEKNKGTSGFEERVKSLEKTKVKAEKLQEISNQKK